MNFRAIKVIYLHEMLRFWQTLFQSVASPILSTALYFVVFGFNWISIGISVELQGGKFGTHFSYTHKHKQGVLVATIVQYFLQG